MTITEKRAPIDQCVATEQVDLLIEAVREELLDKMRNATPDPVQKKASFLLGWKAAIAAAERK